MRGSIAVASWVATLVIGLGAAGAAQDTSKPEEAPAAHAGYGAIAYDEAAGKEGAAWNQPTQYAADKAALKQCDSKGCKVHPVHPHFCAALARSDKDHAWGGAERETLDDAKKEAVAHCQSHTKEGNCEVQLSGCNK